MNDVLTNDIINTIKNDIKNEILNNIKNDIINNIKKDIINDIRNDILKDDDLAVKIRKNPGKKDDRFKEDQVVLAKKILAILDPVNSKSFILYEVDNNDSKKNMILALIPLIKKCCSVGNTIGINRQETCKRAWLSVIKAVFKKVGYDLVSKNCSYNIGLDGELKKYIHTKKYTV